MRHELRAARPNRADNPAAAAAAREPAAAAAAGEVVMASRMRVYVPVKRKPSRSLLGRRRYVATTVTKKLISGRFTNRRAGGIVQGVKDEVTGSGYRLGWRTRPWI